jgi:hypothetical protein
MQCTGLVDLSRRHVLFVLFFCSRFATVNKGKVPSVGHPAGADQGALTGRHGYRRLNTRLTEVSISAFHSTLSCSCRKQFLHFRTADFRNFATGPVI